eukprot:jgi/Bigna1/88766/estExt_fgenesh1_pg.C_380002
MTTRILQAARIIANEGKNEAPQVNPTTVTKVLSEAKKETNFSMEQRKEDSDEREKTLEVFQNNAKMPIGSAMTFVMHMYRAEVGKLAVYRTRLDAPTSWALTVFSLGLSILFTTSQSNAIVPLLVIVLIFFNLLEARRYRVFRTTHYRTRLLERGFYAEVLGFEYEKGWLKKLHTTLMEEGFPVTRFEAFCNRAYRSYAVLLQQ